MVNGTAPNIVAARLAGMHRAAHTGRSARQRDLLLVITLTGALVTNPTSQARAQVQSPDSLIAVPFASFPAENPAVRSAVSVASTLSGVLSDSLGNAVAGATVSIYPPGTNCTGGNPGAVASGTTASGGSFSVPVSPGSYDVWVSYQGGSTDPAFGICTENVDLTSSVNDTLTIPVSQLTVTAKNSNGDLVQGATIPPHNGLGSLAGFDLLPGQAFSTGYLIPDQSFTTGAAGTAIVPLMPMTSPLTLAVDPPAGSDLAPTTISTGLMTTNTAVTATLAEPITLSGVLSDSLGNAVAGATVSIYPPGTNCTGGNPGAVASGTTASGGSFSVPVSPGSYDVWVSYQGGSTDPAFGICTENVDLTSSVNDTLTIPVTQLTVTAKNSNGDLVQGATIPPHNGLGSLAGFDLLPGQAFSTGYLIPDQSFTTGAAGTAIVPLMPMTSPLTLAVDPPAGSDLAPTTISTGLMTTNTAITATLAEKPGPPPPTASSPSRATAAPSCPGPPRRCKAAA